MPFAASGPTGAEYHYALVDERSSYVDCRLGRNAKEAEAALRRMAA
jgi:hypothetical protein